MRFGTGREQVPLGDCCLTISRPGRRSKNGTINGETWECFAQYTMPFETQCVSRKEGRRIHRQECWIARASSRRTSVAPRDSTREKKVKGRKRHLLVDVLGLLLVLKITSADVQDRDAAIPMLRESHREFPTLSKVWVDGAYNGQGIANAAEDTGIDVEMVKRSDDVTGFHVLPKRWIVERTNGWFGKCRILSKEYERTIESSEVNVYLCMISIMLRRLTVDPATRKERR
jgi:transposase